LYCLLPQLPLIPEILRIKVLLHKMQWRLQLLIEHQPIFDSRLALHNLINDAQLHILKLLIQPQKVNQFGILPTDIQHGIDVHLRVFVEVVDGFDRAEHAVVVFVTVHAQVGLARDQQAVALDDGPDAETQVVARALHEVSGGGWDDALHAAVGVLFDLGLGLLFYGVDLKQGVLDDALWQSQREGFSELCECVV
jgi:hypothetical protein